MAIVFIPPQLRQLTGADQVEVGGGTVRAVIDQLELRHPGVRERLIEEGELSPALQLSVGHVMTRLLSTKIASTTEVHFLPVIGGG